MYDGQPPECVSTTSNGKTTSQIAPRPTTRLDPIAMALWWYTTNPGMWAGQLTYNTVQGQRVVMDVFNHVKLMTCTPKGELIIMDDVDFDQIDQPTTTGFIGYLKTVCQQDGIFGSFDAAQRTMELYKAMRIPPLALTFSSFGLPVRALDTVLFNGQPVRVMKVDTTIDMKSNTWMNNFECEWLYPIQFNPAAQACSPNLPPPDTGQGGGE